MSRHRLTLASAVCLFFLVLGANWHVVDQFGSDMPNWDQWDAEGLFLFAPWFGHDHFIAHLFHPQNEHRVVLTKLEALGLELLAGQWDARLECAVNAALHATIAVGFWLAARRWLARRWQPVLFVAIAGLYCLPVAWQNVLGGFHSQQYWLIGLSFAALVGLPFARPWSGGWWAAAAAAAFALLTMGSGFLAAAVVFVVIGFRVLRRELALRAAWPTLASTGLLTALGWFTHVEVDYHASLKAKTAHDFFFSIVHSLEWPLREHDATGALLWLPWLLLVWTVIRRRAPAPGGAAPMAGSANPSDPARSGLTIAALGGWVLIQLVATAYARGAGADYPASRYVDTLVFGAITNLLALGWLLSRRAAPLGRTLAYATLVVAWAIAFGIGLHASLQQVRAELPEVKRFYGEAENHVRGYLATGEAAQLDFPDIPYPGASSLIERLEVPSLRALLPVVVHPPLALQPGAGGNGVWLENHASQLHLAIAPRAGLAPETNALASLPTWGSFAASGVATTGTWTSAPLTAPLAGWLKFETAGDIGRPGVALELHDAATGALLAEVRPTKIPDHTWRAAYARAPRGAFVVVARDADPQRWLAFSAPVEMSRLSHAAWIAVKNGWLIFELALGATGLVAVAAFWPKRSIR